MTYLVDIPAEQLHSRGASECFHRLELPTVQVVGPWKHKRPTRKAMLAGLFYIYGVEARLASPIDWLQDPHGSRTWCYELHTLTWLKEALARHAAGGDVEMLEVARDVVLDWAQAHLPNVEGQSEFAWYDMAVGLRAPYVGYVLRACLAGEMLNEEQVGLLRAVAKRHGAFLADGENYAAGNNHGLFEDEGLYLLARQLPELPAAAAWRELALTRMRVTLGETISTEDGAHLEHSPAYQLAILDLVARLAANVSELPELGKLLAHMRRTAAWQVTPDGCLAQLGDTDDLPAPRWARDAASSLRGMNALFEAGQAFVRDGESFLAVSAAHHGAAHKHSDDTSFLLVENGRTLLGDSGRWGYYEDEADRLYARSAAAHNVLTVDGRDFDWRGCEPYGSGLVATGQGDGWYAIVVRNPLLERQGVEHCRVLLYRPGEALIVLDEVHSADMHQYDRHFHFGSEIAVERSGDGKRLAIAGDGISGTLTNFTGETRVGLERGHEGPHLGWTYPGDRKRQQVWTGVLGSRAKDVTFTAALQFGGEPLDLLDLAVGPRHVELKLDSARSLRVRFDESSAQVEASTTPSR
ncbi:MAG TPA: heparinase II/III family protein [Solirubrobacterales bacterium]|nr:heparinase II/III family protein [Solirubrobacterales bacterium]